MSASRTNRILAFFIDIIVVGILFSILSYWVPNQQVKLLEQNKQDISTSYLNNEMTFQKYFESYANIVWKIDDTKQVETFANLILLFVYFIGIPYITKGYTLGLFLRKCQIVSKKGTKISLLSLFLRSMIVYGTFYLLATGIMVSITGSVPYFLTTTILGFIQILLVIVSGFMVLYRKDMLGLQDILSQSRVITKL